MSVYFVILIIFINFILQSTLLQHFRISGILVNTSLILVVVISILAGRKKGVTAGLLAGFLQDAFFSKAIGINMLIYFYIAYSIGGINRKLFKENNLTPIILITFATIFYHFTYLIIMYFLKESYDFILLLRKKMVVEIVYNIVLGLLVYSKIYNRLYAHRLR